ncbi:MAG: hypothetical protein M3381_14550, partial [Actinomycetota bacterium]|nr:hypothetical protein [Actinomycetota bacterium]
MSGGQFWPQGSETLLRELSEFYVELQTVLAEAANDGAGAYNVIRSGWDSPAAMTFDAVSQNLFTGFDSQVMALADAANKYAQQTSTFAMETEYTKISINVAFWITIAALFITILALWWTGAAPFAAVTAALAALQTAIRSLISKLVLIAARQLTIKAFTQAAAKAVQATMTNLLRTLGTRAATGVRAVPGALRSAPGQMGRTFTTPAGRQALRRELFEEIAEETFIDAATQYQQIRMGTRQDWDWQKTSAAGIGAAGGAVVGTIAGPLSAALPVGKPIRVGLNNTLASPAGSFLANGTVYGNWANPFSTTSALGAFMGGAGRFYGNSPFDPNTYTQFTNGGTKPPDPAEGIPLPDPTLNSPTAPTGPNDPNNANRPNAPSGNGAPPATAPPATAPP